MVKLWRCLICGDPYIGNSPPNNCPFCGVPIEYIIEAKDAEVNFNVILNTTDQKNAKRALEVEVSNAQFYFCAAVKTDDNEGKQLFKALGKVEEEHANVWKKILKLTKVEIPNVNECSTSNINNLKESHTRETRAIKFYKKAAEESANKRVKEIFEAFTKVEIDHLQLSKDRLK